MKYLTIGIPAYNGAFNFKELIQSVSLLGLDTDEYEILIVDNASTDDTEQVIEELSTEVPNLRFYRNEANIGRIANWNKVTELSGGKYLILMNVNDRFVEFDLKTYLTYLDENPEVSLIMSDIINQYPHVTYSYPDWKESGVFNLSGYIKETFLNPDILEFYSLGVLHQHIYRLETIKKNNILFDEAIPRTTDRVFVAEVIANGNGKFYYTGKAMVKWVANQYRYHFAVQQNLTDFDFNALWLNEYKANLKLAVLADMGLKDFLRSQAMYAKYLYYSFRLKKWVDRFKHRPLTAELEEVAALAYYTYIKVQCELNHVNLGFLDTDVPAFQKKFKKPLRRFQLVKKASRSMAAAL